jgi:hypothetical protein
LPRDDGTTLAPYVYLPLRNFILHSAFYILPDHPFTPR